MLALDKAELDAAIAASQEPPSSVLPAIQEQLSRCEPDHSTIHLDLSGVSWETIFQDVVRRSNTLKFISIISSFTCSKMEPNAFGGMAVVITGTNIRGKSTEDILEELLEEEEAGLFAPISSEKGAPANV